MVVEVQLFVHLLDFAVPAAWAANLTCNASAASGVICSVCARANSNLDSCSSNLGQFEVGRKESLPSMDMSAVGRGGGGRRSTGGGRSIRKLSISKACVDELSRSKRWN